MALLRWGHLPAAARCSLRGVLPPSYAQVYDTPAALRGSDRTWAVRARRTVLARAEEFRAASFGAVRRAPVLRGLTADQLYGLWLQGEVTYDRQRQVLVPCLAGASEAGLYAVTANGITTGTALKTLLEVISGANVAPTLFQWHCEFNGSAAAAGILVELLRATGGFTGGTAVTPTLLQPGRKAVQSTCNSGIAAAVNTTEGTRGAIIEQHYVPPTSGIIMQYPLAREPEIAVSDRMRISATAAAAVNSATGMQFSE